MEKQNIRTKERMGARKDSFAIIGIITYIASLLFRVFLYYFVGEKGVGYFGIANEIYVAVSFFFAYGLSEAVAILVRYRVKRDQYKNAAKVLKFAFFLAIALGVILTIIMLVAGQFLAQHFFGLPHASLAIQMMAPSLLFCMIIGVMRGYFQGSGSKVPSMHSKCLETIAIMIAGMIGASALFGYGQKVSALLQNEDYASAYGAMGASCGFLVATVLGCLHLFLLLLIYKRRISGNEIRDMQRGQESGVHILRMLIVTAAPYAAYAFVFHCLPLLDGCFYLNASKESTEAIHLWGNYYGKYMVVIGVFASLVALTTIEPLRKIIGLIDREEYRLAREKAGFLLHQIALLTVPTAVFTAVLAENILNLFFKGNNTKTAEWIMWGSLIIVLYVYALLFMNMLVRLKKMRLVTGCGAVAVLVHVIVTLLLLKNTLLGMTSLVIGNIVFYLLLAAAGAFFVGKSISLSLINVKGIAFTIVSAAIAGLIVMLLNKALVAVLGTTIALVICLPVGVTAYLVLVIVTRAVNERDMQNIRGGGVLLAVARLMHFI